MMAITSLTSCMALLLLIQCTGTVVCIQNKSEAHLLHDYLFITQGYNKKLRPALNATAKTDVHVSLALLSLVNFDEVSETLTVTGKLTMTWIDEYLAWNPDDFGGVDSISVPQDDVWKPDLTLENAVQKSVNMGTSAMFVSVKASGLMKWKPMEVFQSTCAADVTTYPYDKHSCCLRFESWSYHADRVLLLNTSDKIVLKEYDGQPEWSVIGTSASHLIKGHDTYVIFCVDLGRQWMHVMLNVVLPISLLSFLSTCVFLLPASCGEKASYSVTLFLALCVFLTIVSQQLPPAANNVSMFNIYVFSQVLLSTIITLSALVQIRLYFRSKYHPLPTWLCCIINCCARRKQGSVSSENVGDYNQDNGVENFDPEDKKDLTTDGVKCLTTWTDVANWLDPVLFAFYISLNILLTLVLLIYATNK